MRYTPLQVCAALLVLGSATGAQVPATPPTPPAQPAPDAREARVRATEERARAAEARVRSTEERARTAEARANVAMERALQRTAPDSATLNRAILGITLGHTGSKRDTLGIFVSAVAENGPAERAGIYEGDRIAAINGVDVRTTASDAGDAYLRGVANRRLTLEMRKLTAGQRVNLRVWSGGRYKDVQVTTARYADVYGNRRVSINLGDGFSEAMGALERMRIELPEIRREFRLAPHLAPDVRIIAPRIRERMIRGEPNQHGVVAGGHDTRHDVDIHVDHDFDFQLDPGIDLDFDHDIAVELAPLDFHFEHDLGSDGDHHLDHELDAGIDFNYDDETDVLTESEASALADEAVRQASETLQTLDVAQAGHASL